MNNHLAKLQDQMEEAVETGEYPQPDRSIEEPWWSCLDLPSIREMGGESPEFLALVEGVCQASKQWDDAIKAEGEAMGESDERRAEAQDAIEEAREKFDGIAEMLMRQNAQSPQGVLFKLRFAVSECTGEKYVDVLSHAIPGIADDLRRLAKQTANPARHPMPDPVLEVWRRHQETEKAATAAQNELDRIAAFIRRVSPEPCVMPGYQPLWSEAEIREASRSSFGPPANPECVEDLCQELRNKQQLRKAAEEEHGYTAAERNAQNLRGDYNRIEEELVRTTATTPTGLKKQCELALVRLIELEGYEEKESLLYSILAGVKVLEALSGEGS